MPRKKINKEVEVSPELCVVLEVKKEILQQMVRTFFNDHMVDDPQTNGANERFRAGLLALKEISQKAEGIIKEFLGE